MHVDLWVDSTAHAVCVLLMPVDFEEYCVLPRQFEVTLLQVKICNT